MNPDTARLKALHNRHSGATAVLVANGPSLNQMDLSFLQSQITIGLNKIYLGFTAFRFYPKYYVVVNRLVIEQAAAAIRAMNCIKFVSRRSVDLVPENAMTYHIDTLQPQKRFCRDIATQGVHEGWTVTYAALQIAFFLGFSRVVIVGMDHRYQFDGQPNEIRRMEGPDPNHFDGSYFGGGQKWDNPDLERSEESYRLARQVYQDDGRQILDATVDGACNVFEKVDYRALFQKASKS